MASSNTSNAGSSHQEQRGQKVLDVIFLCDEWKSSKGGLSTFNREFAINLAQATTGSMKIHCYVSYSDDRDREDANQHGVNLITARSVPGSADPLECLKFPPSQLPNPHLVIGHGRKLGIPANFLAQSTKCKWVQFVHVYCEDLGKYKESATAAEDTIEENEKKHKIEIDLCKAADAVVAVGSRLQQKYSRRLLNVEVKIITPGIFGKFSNESKLAVDRSVVKNFNVSLFGRAAFEDLSLEGYDVVANAIGSLGENFELTFVGSSPGEQRKVEQWFLDNTCINRNQLTIRRYCSQQEELKLMFYQSDLVALPSRTEGFGLVALQAISAGVPVLVSGESGIAEALQKVEGGNTVIVGSGKDKDEWARRIREIYEESAEEREANAVKLRENYRKVYSWKAECERFKGLIENVVKTTYAGELSIKVDVDDFKPEEQNMQTGILATESVRSQEVQKKYLYGELNIYVDVDDLKPEEQNIQTGILATESVRCQEVQQPRVSATSAASGSVSDPQTEDLKALKEKAFLSIVQNYLMTTPPESPEEYSRFMEYARKMRLIITGVAVGSLVITVKCKSLMILEELWTDFLSGHLSEVVQNCFVTEKIMKELNLAELRLKTTINKEEYNACKMFFENDALRGALSSEFHSTSSTSESSQKQEELKKRKLKTKIVETEKLKGTSPPSYMFTTGREKEREELPKAMRLQERKESAGFQKDPHQKAYVASATVGSLVHTGTKDFQTMEDKILSLIQSNYLQTMLQQSAEDRDEFQEYLEKLATGTSPPSDMFTTGHEREQKELSKAMRLQERKEFSTRNSKISVSKSEITEEGGALMVQNVPSRVLIPPKALPTCTEVTCSLWNQQVLSPPLGRNEALVSSVMELACGNLPGTEERYEFNVKVKVALSHSASDIKGYELVIKELTNEKTNDWRDLKTRWAWTPSDIKDEHSGVDEFPDWLFPFAETEITSFSSFAVVWRLKSFTFKNPSTLSSSFPCILSDHPGVSVTFPESSLPTGQAFALTVQVQEVPCSNAKLKEPLVVGPILHISTSEPVQLLAPARLTIPVTLREDIPKCLDYSATDVRIFCRTSEEDEREWNEVTEQLGNIAVLESGTVTFTVNHFSSYWVWIDRLKLPFVTLKNLADDFCRRLMLQEVGFFARLYATENPPIYVLNLWCFPIHLKEEVKSKDLRPFCAQGGGNSRKPLCKEDRMSVSLSEAFTLMQEENLDNFLRFIGTDPYEESLRVSISDLSNLQVELYMENQSHRDKLCTLNFTPTLPDQTSSPRYFPSTAQVAMPEQKEDQVALESSTSFPSPKAPEETASNNFSKEDLKVTILADEWNSLKGGLSTFNRELAIHLASQSDTQVTFLVPHGSCGLEEKAAAAKNCVSIMEAKKLTACPSPVELFFPPKGLGIDVVIGHGMKLGQQAQIIRESHDCKWVQVVHTAPDELGMYKDNPKAIAQSEEKNQREVSLCEIADLVMAVGPKLKGFYSNHLRSFNKDQNVVEFTPGIMRDLIDVKLSQDDNDEFQVLMFGRGDDEDFKLKGYDIVAEAFASHELKNDSYHLTFVGATPGKQDEFAAKILKFGISKNQLSVKEYIKDRNRLKELLLRMDLVIMPSRTEGFGLTALEALSAGLPILAGHNSGFSKALQKVRFGELCVVNSDKPEDWSKAIKKVRQKERKKRLDEMQRLREFYEQNYNWKEQCEFLVKEMRRKVFA